jgi:GT2 family glycosyltransferase
MGFLVRAARGSAYPVSLLSHQNWTFVPFDVLWGQVLEHCPAVSVVIPVFCREGTIERALASVTAQTLQDYEILVVDDGSTDRTVEVVEALGLKGLKLIRHATNRGPAAARNTGITAAQGRWIALLDSDDEWSRDKLARQLAAMQAAGPKVRGCATGFQLVRNDQTSTVRLNCDSADFRKLILFGCSISPGATLLVERAVFEEIGLFDESLRRLEDWDWLLRFVRRYDLTFVPDPLATIHVGSSGDPGREQTVLEALRQIRLKHLPQLANAGDRQRLRSSLLIERAAIAWRQDQLARAVALTVAAVVIYPFRNQLFFRMLGRSAVASLRGGRGGHLRAGR